MKKDFFLRRLEGSFLMMAIGRMAGTFKEGFIKERHQLQMSEQEVVEMIDEVSSKIIHKYLEV